MRVARSPSITIQLERRADKRARRRWRRGNPALIIATDTRTGRIYVQGDTNG